MIDVDIDLKDFELEMSAIVKKQIPFALSVALNDTAWQSKEDVAKYAERTIDRPTKFTLRGFAVKKSTKRRLYSEVFIKPIQAEYLEYQIEGKTRRPESKAIPIPVNQRLNKFGNIPGMKGGKKINALLAKPNVFKGMVRGVYGIWQRRKRGPLKLLIAFKDKAQYEEAFDFEKAASKSARARFGKNFQRAWTKALASART